MSSDPRRRRHDDGPPCDEFGPDDGIDPRLLFRNDHRRSNDDRKNRQLCAQAAQALTFAFTGVCRDPVLQLLDVTSVEPAPDARRLHVIVEPLGELSELRLDLADVRRRLANAHGILREAVAAAVRRRRAPDLVFEVRPYSEPSS